MIGGNISEFIDQLYYGQEIVFIYNGKRYFIQGWWSDDKTTATLVLDCPTENQFTHYMWKHHASKMSECVDAFLAAKIWDGKDFLHIQEYVTWSDW